MHIISLKNTTYPDFGRETWIKNYLKDYSLFKNVSALSDRSKKVNYNANRSLKLRQR